MMTNQVCTELLQAICRNPRMLDKFLKLLDTELSLPNIKMPTMGGKVFWENLAEADGWRLQQNTVTRHARILNPQNERIAWGTLNGMKKALARMQELDRQYGSCSEFSFERRSQARQELRELKELLDLGAITEQEFQQKKALLKDLI